MRDSHRCEGNCGSTDLSAPWREAEQLECRREEGGCLDSLAWTLLSSLPCSYRPTLTLYGCGWGPSVEMLSCSPSLLYSVV